jgi:hypothetical protein
MLNKCGICCWVFADADDYKTHNCKDYNKVRALEAENTRLKGELEEAREALRVVGVQLGDMAALTDSPALAAFCRALITRTESTPAAAAPGLEPCVYRMPKPHEHVRIDRTFMAGQGKPWYIICGPGNGASKDYWREDEGWSFSTPSRYATAEDAARAFLAATPVAEPLQYGKPDPITCVCDDTDCVCDFAAEPQADPVREERAGPIGWLYKIIVDKHLTGNPRNGQIQINGVWGTPSNHIYFSPETPTHQWIWWQSPVYLPAATRTEKPSEEKP